MFSFNIRRKYGVLAFRFGRGGKGKGWWQDSLFSIISEYEDKEGEVEYAKVVFSI